MSDSLHAAVRREYSLLAPIYDRAWRGYLATTLRRTIACLDLSGSERVLDVGCGTGILLRTLADAHPGLVLHGVDLTPRMLALAKKRLGPRAVLTTGSGDELPYRDSSFDVVVSTSMLHCLEGSQRRAVSEWARMLAPGGTLIVTDWRADHPGTRAHVALLKMLWRRHYRAVLSEDLALMVRDAGLEIDTTESYRAGTWGVTTVSAHSRRD